MTNPLPFVSVVVPTRNRASLLRDCVESLVKQDYPADHYEIIVVDDGSSDQTPEVVPSIRSSGRGPSLRYMRLEGRGLIPARNTGLHAAHGDPIVFVDDDVIAPESWLGALAHGSLRYPDAGCLGGPVRLRLEGKLPRFCERDPLGDSQLDLGSTERSVDRACGANMALRRAAIQRIGLFNEALVGHGDESEWESRLLGAGGRIMYLPEAWLWHRRTARDLAVWRLLRARFQRGCEVAAYARVVGQPMSLTAELLAIPRFLAHAARRWCVGGLLSASGSAGRAWGLVRDRGLKGVLPLKRKSA